MAHILHTYNTPPYCCLLCCTPLQVQQLQAQLQAAGLTPCTTNNNSSSSSTTLPADGRSSDCPTHTTPDTTSGDNSAQTKPGVPKGSSGKRWTTLALDAGHALVIVCSVALYMWLEDSRRAVQAC